jgi:hypothetical protein
MKSVFFILSFIFLTVIYADAQGVHDVHGVLMDSTKVTLPASTVQLKTDLGDSTATMTDANGKFSFSGIKANKITISITSIGYQSVRKHYVFDNNNNPIDVGPIILKTESNMLAQVNIIGVTPIVFKEDTTEYKASAYPVRENAPIEDVIKKLPGVDVDVNGNITTQGKQVTKVRVNGKDFMGGDVQSITKNLPADVVENIQMIDDYGDQANLTGVKTGEPDKIMNITIRKDRNYGYTLQATGGDGEDALPASQGITDENRYLGTVNSFIFNGDQQIAILGSINNTNVNTFSFGSNSPGGGGGFGGGGGGRGNAARGSQNSGSLITSQNGITDARSIGSNFRDQWGKNLSVYGSYSFADNTVTTNSINNQENLSADNPSTNYQKSNETDRNINHRFTWNMEYKPDTINYLKITPTFSYASTTTNETETNRLIRKDTASNSAYNSNTYATSTAPSFGLIALYNHRLPHRHNLSINLTLSSTATTQYQNPIYIYTVGAPTTAPDQMINTYSRTNSVGTTVSYLQPVGKVSYLEFNYAFNYASTTNNKETDTSFTITGASFLPDSALSNLYNYTFMTNRFGLNYRVVEKKYNYTLGVAVQPSVLDGSSPVTGATTHVSTFNVIPTAQFVYNFSRGHAFRVNYNGSSSSPSFSQLQPVTDFSNAEYPVQGNPYLKPQFTNNFSIRYNAFDFQSGNVLFTYLIFTQINNYITTNTVTFPSDYTTDPRFKNTILTQYLNASGYYTTSANLVYAKPWDNRKFTLQFLGTLTYSNTPGYLTNVSSDSSNFARTTEENIQKNLQLTPGMKFRVDITNVIDAQFLTNYAINHTDNTVQNSLTNGTSNIRTWNLALNGKNYFGDWTFSYDYSKAINYGYATNLGITNPNILNVYLERRFLKQNRATIRLSAFDLFNENTGFSSTQTVSSLTQSSVNRLARYYLATFTLRLQKFSGKAPEQSDGQHGFRRDHGGPGGGGPGGPGGGGPGGVPD